MGQSVEGLAWFPEWETLPYEATAPHVALIAHRMTTLHRLLVKPPTILVTSVAAAMHRVIPRSLFEEAVIRFKTGATFERESLITSLLRIGYRRVSVVEIPGEFSIRGGIVDIFSTAYPNPIRVEFLGDQVESMRLFDAATQTSIEKLTEGWVLPVAPRERVRLTPRAAVLVFCVFVVAMFAIAPIRGYLDQRAQLADLERQAAVLERQDAALEERIDALNDPRTLERLARERLGMVEPGEIAFVTIPQGEAPAPPDCG